MGETTNMMKATYEKRRDFKEPTWVGKVKVYENGKYLWSQTTPVLRLFKHDAVKDAQKLIKELQA